MRLPLLVLLVVAAGSLGAAAAGADEAHPAEQSANPQEVKLGFDYFKGYFTDTGAILISPLSWGGPQWLTFSAVVVATYAVSTVEGDVQNWVQVRRNDDSDMVAGYVEPFGSGKYVLPALIGLYGCGRIAGSDRTTRTALLSLESVVVSGAFTMAIKYLTHKQRPNPNITDDIPWNGPSFSHDHLSFPSGHASCGFAVATVVAMEYRDYAFVPPLVYFAATLASLSRVHDNAHWTSDVMLGAAIGHFTAKAIVGRHGGGARSRVSLVPTSSSGGVGLALSCKF